MATTEMLFGDHPSEGSSGLQLASPNHLLSLPGYIDVRSEKKDQVVGKHAGTDTPALHSRFLTESYLHQGTSINCLIENFERLKPLKSRCRSQ